ncbi:MAG: UvrD-helicase domain-containing protein [Candidatus Aureabacteria bacterium]|nr:UvrD-helicase domain-containing protein [Candidatus Auribacterota bacterium]
MKYKWEKQIEDVLNAKTKAAVSASAGTGKTTFAMNKVIRLIEEGRDDKERREISASICCITFTKKAAGDFKERAKEILLETVKGSDFRARFNYVRAIDEIQISTIHSFAVKILREFCSYADIDPDSEIIDGDKQKILRKALRQAVVSRLDSGKDAVLNRVLAVLPLEKKGFQNGFEDYIFDIVNNFRSADISGKVENFVSKAVKNEREEIRRISLCLAGIADDVLEKYESLKQNRITYDEILVKARNLLRDHKDVRQEIKKRYKLIILDEAQDTDNIQMEFVMWLSEKEDTLAGNISEIQLSDKIIVVGDFKQSIYGWRNADPAIFGKIQEQIGLKRSLRENRRSQKELLDYINNLSSLIISDFDKSRDLIKARRKEAHDSGRVYRLFNREGFETAEGQRRKEAECLSLLIKQMAEEGTLNGKEVKVFRNGKEEKPLYSDIAVLFRKLTKVDIYEKCMQESGIPYFIVSNSGFLSRFEVRDSLNFLNIMSNARDELAYASLLRSFASTADDDQIICGKLKDRILKPAKLSNGGETTAVHELDGILLDMRQRKNTGTPSELLNEFLERTSYFTALAKLADGDIRIANVKKLVEKIRALESSGYDSLEEIVQRFIDDINFESDEGLASVSGEGDNSVKLMTVHRSKGLQFPIVIIPDTSSGRFIGDKLMIKHNGTFAFRMNKYWETSNYEKEKNKAKYDRSEEEKRLLYVAVTRARDILIVSCLNKKPESGNRKNSLNTWYDCLKDVQPAQDIYIEDRYESEPAAAPGKSARVVKLDVRQNLEFADADIGVLSPSVEKISVSRYLDKEGYLLPRDIMEQETDELSETEEDGLADKKENIGTAVHYALEHMASKKDIIRLLKHKLPENEALKIAPEIERFVETPGYREIEAADEIYRELPFVLREGNYEITGRIDCVYRKNDRITIVDFKWSDYRGERYNRQLEIYRRAFEKHSGDMNIETRILYIKKGG